MEFKVGDRVEFYFGDDKCEGVIKKVKPYGRYEIIDDDYIFYDTSIDNITKITKEKKKTTLEELEQRIEKLEKEVFKPLTIKGGIKKYLEENLEISLKPSILTEDERVILRNVDKKFKWIARSGRDLKIYAKKPKKENIGWYIVGIRNFECLFMFNHLFQFIKWEDDEPYNIEELLKGECGNEN